MAFKYIELFDEVVGSRSDVEADTIDSGRSSGTM